MEKKEQKLSGFLQKLHDFAMISKAFPRFLISKLIGIYSNTGTNQHIVLQNVMQYAFEALYIYYRNVIIHVFQIREI